MHIFKILIAERLNYQYSEVFGSLYFKINVQILVGDSRMIQVAVLPVGGLWKGILAWLFFNYIMTKFQETWQGLSIKEGPQVSDKLEQGLNSMVAPAQVLPAILLLHCFLWEEIQRS